MRRISLLLFGFILSTSVFAMMPVIDIGSISKTIELINQGRTQLEQMKRLYDVNTNQLDFLQKNLNGNFNYGRLFNEVEDLNRRQWSNDSWMDALNRVSNGRTSAFGQAQRMYEKIYPVTSADKIATTRRDGGLTRTYYQQSSNISRTALAASSYSYDHLNDHIKQLHDILSKLDEQSTEKAAIDLNARLVAELGFIELEVLRQSTINNQLAATQTQGEVNSMSYQAQFMQWHSN